MDNHIEQATQYAKLSALYKTIIYLQDEAKKRRRNIGKIKKEGEQKCQLNISLGL